jgi:hypothetical protein
MLSRCAGGAARSAAQMREEPETQALYISEVLVYLALPAPVAPANGRRAAGLVRIALGHLSVHPRPSAFVRVDPR